MTCPCCGMPICECVELDLSDMTAQLKHMGEKAAEFAYLRSPKFAGPEPIRWEQLSEESRQKIRKEFLTYAKE